MKFKVSWMASLLMAGSAIVAVAGPGVGPYGPWNSGGAYGGFGPYDPYVARGYPIRAGLSPVAEYRTIDVERTGCPARVLPVVGERTFIAAEPEFVGERVVTVEPVAERIGTCPAVVGERFARPVTTTGWTWRGRPRIVEEEITTTTYYHGGKAKRAFHARAGKRLEAVGEKTGKKCTCKVKRLTPVGERIIRHPMKKRVIYRPAPVGERIIRTAPAPVMERTTTEVEFRPYATRRGIWPFSRFGSADYDYACP